MHAATVAEIAEAAGLSAGLLYCYFPGKVDLAIAIVERERVRTVEAIDGLLAIEDPRAALGLLIDGWIDAALADRRAAGLVADITAEAAREGALAVAAVAHEDAVVKSVAALVERAAPDHPDAPAVASLLVSALDGLTMRVAIGDDFNPRPSAAALRRALPSLLAAPSP